MEIDKALYKACKDNIKLEEQLDKYKKEIEYEQHCNEQLRNKITNLEYKIKRLEEDNKYKEVLDKIKKIINNKAFFDPAMPNCNALGQKATLDILELLEEIE